MADQQAGSVFVRIVGEADKTQVERELETELRGIKVDVPVAFKIASGAVSDLVKNAQVEFDKRKALPRLPIKFKIAAGAVTEIVKDSQTAFDKRKALPRLPVRFKIAKGEVGKVVKEAEAAGKANPVDIRANLDATSLIQQVTAAEALLSSRIDTQFRMMDKLAATAAKKVAESNKARIASTVEMLDELDQIENQRTEARVYRERRLIEERADLSPLIAASRREAAEAATQGRLTALTQEGLDQRSLIELRHANQVALIHERAEARKRGSSGVTLRQLRNDLSQFDASTTRVLRRLGLGFGIFTAGVVASFGAITVASLASFAKTEVQLRRTAAVLGTDVFSQLTADGKGAEEAFAGFRAEVERTDVALTGLVNDVALKTVFDPTEIAEGTRSLAQAGLNVEQINKSLLGVAQFAQNEELLPQEAVENLVQGATASGESLAKLTALADKFTFVANNTTATATEVAQAFSNRAAPAFRAYGEEVNATLTVLDLFAAAGIRGKTAGEQAGILIREINKAATKTPATTAAFKKYGVEIGKVNGVQVPFVETLGELGFLLERVRKDQGSGGLARVRKELGLTEKSGAGLLQILPQISQGLDGSADSADEAVAGLKRLEKQIGTATLRGGATARQAEVITDTLSFQTEQFANSIQTLFKEAAAPLGNQLTDLFKELNGETGKGIELADRLRGQFVRTGKAVADVLVPALRSFAQGGEGADFFSGLVATFKGTLNGLRGAFSNFRAEVFGEGSQRGFFTIIGDGLAAIGRFSADTLPRIGRGLGILVSLVKENKDVAEGFVKAWLGLFVASKALRLFVIPLASVTDNLDVLKRTYQSIIGLQIVQSIIGQTQAMRGLETATKATTVATNALAAAEARQAAASAASAIPLPGARPRSFRRLKPEVAPIDGKAILRNSAQADAAFARSEARAAKLTLALGKLKGGFALAAKATIAIPIALGIVKGAVDQLSASFGGDGNVTLKDFRNTLASLGGVISAIIKPVFSFLNLLTKILFIGGKIIGSSIIILLTGFVRGLGAAFVWAGKQIASFIGLIGDLVAKIPGVTFALEKAGDAAGAVGDALGGLKGAGGDALGFVGRQARSLAQSQRELYGETNALSPIFDSLGESIDGADAKAAKNAATNKRNREEAAKAAAALEKQTAKFRVLGIENGIATNAAIAWTRGNRALGLSLQQSAANATVFQKRSANAALVLKVLGDRTRNTALYQKILGAASTDLATNIDSLTGKKGSINDLLKTIADGSDRAAKAALRSATAMVRLTEAAQISKATRQGTVTSRVIIQQVQAARDQANRSIAAFRSEFKNRGKDEQDAFAETVAGLNDVGGAAAAASSAVAEVKDAATLAAEAVDKMSVAQFRSSANALIGRIAKLPGVYKATVRESAILQRAIPALDKVLEKQRVQVTKLDEALQSLQSTQLAGTKAANDAAFGFDQEVKALQLQQVDLRIGGATDEDPRIKALDEQIAAIQLKSERASLAAGLALDPLKKKLEETFSPVKELSFDQIISQFQSLNQQKIVLDAKVGRGEALKAKLDAVVAGAADKFADVGLAVTGGINAGLAAGNASVVTASKKTANTITSTIDTTLGIASPSKVMYQRGFWTTQGLANGVTAARPLALDAMRDVRNGMLAVIDNGLPLFNVRGQNTITSFLAGMKLVWTRDVKPFVLEIAEWIKDNKGPISYDAQLLRPAGEAMMSGFHGGLRDGFSEVKGWVRGVAGSIGDNFPKEMFFERSAKFLLNNVKADTTFNPEDAFGDLLPQVFGGIGVPDPTLSFLHKTLSAADTAEMARKLIALYPSMNFNQNSSQFLRPEGTRTASGNISDHTFGTAADLGTGSSSPTAASRALFAKLKPLLGIVFKQLIHAGLGINAGGGTFADSAHDDHIHASWLKGVGFDKYSGKKGVGMLNIPGVPSDVLNAISVASQKYSMNPALIAAVMKQESGFRKNVVSYDGGYGLMQLTSSNLVAAADAIGGRTDPVANALIGTKYLSDLIKQLGSVKLGLSAYNSGPGGGERYGRIDVPNYVSSVMRYFEEYLKKFGGTGIGVGTFRRQGGRLNAGQASWVGEGGGYRELFIPDRSGTVISNRNVESLIRMAQTAAQPQAAPSITYAPQIDARSNSDNPATVAAIMDARMRAQMTGIRR